LEESHREEEESELDVEDNGFLKQFKNGDEDVPEEEQKAVRINEVRESHEVRNNAMSPAKIREQKKSDAEEVDTQDWTINTSNQQMKLLREELAQVLSTIS
jgi:hypothetical protein